jgi:hypothetical protein
MSKNYCMSLIRSLELFILTLFFLSFATVAVAGTVNPIPLISWPLMPTSIAPAGAAFTLTVHGTGFVVGSVVRWNGSPRPTTFVNKSELTAAIPVTDISHANTFSVTVFNPSPGGGSSNVVFFQVRAVGTWAPFSPAVQVTGAGALSLVTGDFNADHKLDLAVLYPSSNNISFLLGNGDGTFKPTVEYSVGQNPVAAAVGDFNSDGKLDLVVVNNYSFSVSVLLGNGNGTFQAAVEYGVGQYPTAVAVGDFNQDGKLDVVVTDSGSNEITVLLGNGAGSFTSAVTYSVGQNPSSVAIGDFNHDGTLDLVVTNHDSHNVSVLLGNGNGTFQAAAEYVVDPNPMAVVVGDFNQDGKLDVGVAEEASGYGIAVLLGNGDGTFQSATLYYVDSADLALGDLNGDGKLDLAIAEPGGSAGGRVTTLLGNGHGSFQETVGYTVPQVITSIAVGDFNGDGKLDLATADGGAGISILLQTQPLSGPNATVSSTNMVLGCYYVFGRHCVCVRAGFLTLSNYGNETLNISGIAIKGPFSEENSCGTSLKPGQFCTIRVWFGQKSPGSGTLSISDNASGSPQTVSLIGEQECNLLALGNTASHAACAMNSLSLH